MPNVVSSTKSAVRLVAALAGLTCGLGCDTEPGATMVESAAAASPRSEIAAAAQSTTSPAPTSQAAPPRPAEAPAPASDRPRLVVLVVFDQFRGDFIGRWEKLFGDGGLRRLTGEGAWYQNCHYPYSGTFTGPGHASMLAGCTPSVHGIWTNDWHSRDELRKVNCVNGPESKQTPPPPPKAMAPAGYTDGATPRRFHAETFADVLKRETAGRGKVVALSMKSRSAVLPAGREPDGCYWFDDRLGAFVTSDYYRAEVEEWVAKFNAGRPADAWWDKPWERLRPDLDYAKYSSPDDAPGEGLGVYQGRVFPHPLNGGLNEIGERYYEAVYNSPFSNELLWSLAKTAITENRLGADDDVDLLSISFSGNDAVGHTWGPDSQEALDTTLRSDAIVAEILKTLDEKVGAGRYLVALTADHGVCPLTQYSAAHGVDASRMPSDQLREGADRMLTAKFFPNETQPKKWIAASDNNWHYLNQAVVQAAQAETAAVESELANWLMQQPGVAKAYTRTAFINHTLPDDEFAKAASLSFDADRCGDVMIVLQPNWLWVYGDNSGTTHGSPHPYDTWVPLVVFGHGVKPGNRQEKVAPLTIGPIFSQALGFPAPAQTEFPAPANLWKTEAKNAK